MAGQGNIQAFLNTPQAIKPQKGAPETRILPAKADQTKVLPGGQRDQQQKAQAAAVQQQQQEARAQRQAQRQAEAQQKEDQATAKAGAQAIGTGLQSAKDRLGGIGTGVESWAENVPTPGGIGLILLAIIFLLWMVVPVNGSKTRLQLLWLTLTGRTRLAASPDGGGTYDPRGAGGSFGQTAPGAGFGSGGSANGHSTTSTADLLAQLNIRDWGGPV